MAISARLYRSLQNTLGDAAEDLVTWMQRMDENRSELRELNDLSFARVDSRFSEQRHWIDAQFAEFRRTVDADLAELRQEMQAGFTRTREEWQTGVASVREDLVTGLAGVREEVRGVDATLRTEIARSEARLLRWSFVFWATAILTMVSLAR